MGRIKTALVKRSAQQMFDGSEIFNNSFEHNKKILGDKMPSKSVRNKIAGQLVNLSKKKSAPRKIKKIETDYKESQYGSTKQFE